MAMFDSFLISYVSGKMILIINICFVPVNTSLFFYKRKTNLRFAWLFALYFCYDSRGIDGMAMVSEFK